MRLFLYVSFGCTGHADTELSVNGDVLHVNGAAFDLSDVQNGDIAEPTGEHPFAGQITRVNGILQVPVSVVVNPVATMPFVGAEPLEVLADGGSVVIPVKRYGQEDAA